MEKNTHFHEMLQVPSDMTAFRLCVSCLFRNMYCFEVVQANEPVYTSISRHNKSQAVEKVRR